MLIILLSCLGLNFLHYRLARTHRLAALCFCIIQSMIIWVCYIEAFIAVFPTEITDIFPGIFALLGTYSIISYDQGSLLGTYLMMQIYQITRHYFEYIRNGDQAVTLTAMRFTVSTMLAFLFIFIFSRGFNSRERTRFIQEKQQKQLLQLFNTLIRSHHDGILITSGNQILLVNDKVNTILVDKKNQVEQNKE